MRPPDLPGGNTGDGLLPSTVPPYASMRPPDLPGGNAPSRGVSIGPLVKLQ